MQIRPKIALIILIISTIGFGFYFYQKNQGANRTAPDSAQETQTTFPQTVDDLNKQSASQEIDPNLQATANSNNSNSTSTTSQNSTKVTISADCLEKQAQTFTCYEEYYEKVVKANGIPVAFADLKQRFAGNTYIQSQCHPITHIIGRTAAATYGDVGVAYSKGDSYCWSGYYHGVMEGVIAKIAPQDLPGKIDGICANIPGKVTYSFDYYNCVHGLGHGVMAISQNELFDSLKLCDNIIGNWEQSSCWGGAFMENVIVDNKNHYTKYLKLSEPLYPCNAVDDKYKTTCYLMQTSYMLKVTNGDFDKVFDLCSTVDNFSATCYQSLGRDASGRSISNVAQTKATCDLGNNFDQKSNCIIGAVKDFISYHHSDAQAKQLCAALEVDLQPVCNSTAQSYYKVF